MPIQCIGGVVRKQIPYLASLDMLTTIANKRKVEEATAQKDDVAPGKDLNATDAVTAQTPNALFKVVDLELIYED